MNNLKIITPGEQTLLEIAELAARSGVLLVERGGVTALCGKANIPPGWHVAPVTVKAAGVRQ